MKKQKILVTGINGFIGSRFKKLAADKFQITGFVHQGNKSIRNREYAFNLIKKSSADIILHLAACTHIDRCEAEKPKGTKSLPWQINVIGTKNIADACAENKKFLVFLSTECVFDGKDSWYKETDEPRPVNWYGITKLEGEREIEKSKVKYLILRSTLAYGHPVFNPYDPYHFFLNKILNNQYIKAVDDQHLSLTFVDDLVASLKVLIENKAHGLFHYAGGESISPYEFALLIGKYFKKPIQITPVTLNDFFGLAAKLRLKNATLSSAKIKKDFNLQPSDLSKALKKLMLKA